MENKKIKIRNTDINIANNLPLAIIGGINVIESYELAEQVCQRFIEITAKHNIPYIFKASFDKANRSSIKSFRGIGIEEGLQVLAEIKRKFGVPIITDIHEPYQAKLVEPIVDIIQIPAFLSRQTDLIIAAAKTNLPINIKKAQFLSPHEMNNIINKFQEANNHDVMLCERGSMFGYNNLVVDMLGFPIMKQTGCPFIFDVTHSLQQPGGKGFAADGRGEFVFDLAKSAVIQGIAGLFIETHPEPSKALCDGACALPLGKLELFIDQISKVDNLAKSFNT